MPLYKSDSHSRHPNDCNEQPFLLHTTCVLGKEQAVDE